MLTADLHVSFRLNLWQKQIQLSNIDENNYETNFIEENANKQEEQFIVDSSPLQILYLSGNKVCHFFYYILLIKIRAHNNDCSEIYFY